MLPQAFRTGQEKRASRGSKKDQNLKICPLCPLDARSSPKSPSIPPKVLFFCLAAKRAQSGCAATTLAPAGLPHRPGKMRLWGVKKSKKPQFMPFAPPSCPIPPGKPQHTPKGLRILPCNAHCNPDPKGIDTRPSRIHIHIRLSTLFGKKSGGHHKLHTRCLVRKPGISLILSLILSLIFVLNCSA